MAYGKKTYKKTYTRRYKRKPNIQSRGSYIGNMTLGQTARYALKGVNMLKGIVNAEKKRFDVRVTSSSSTTAAIAVLTGVAQGDDATDRNGNSILAKYMQVRVDTTMSGSATATVTRMIILVDTQNQGTNPTAALILQDPTTYLSPLNIDSTQRFTVLCDKFFTTSINGQRMTNYKRYIPLNFHLKYTGSAGSTFNKNNIFVLYMSNEATNVPDFTLYSRLVFYDN